MEIGTCYVTKDIDELKMGHVIVTRRHTDGRISIAVYLVDMACLGVKDSLYRLRMDDWEFDEFLSDRLDSFRECSYEEAHNRVWGSVAWAEETGIKPDKTFSLTQYMLEEDTDDIPLIEYEYGRDGKHFLTCRSELEASRYLPLMRKNLGEGNYHYIIGVGVPGFDDDSTDEYDDYAFREDAVVSNFDLPVTRLNVSDIVEARGINIVKYMNHILHIGISENLTDEQQQKMYTEYILSHPEELLRRLPKNEIDLLLFLLANRDQARGVLYANDRSPLMMEIACVANSYNDGHGLNRVRVADDFQRVALSLAAGIRMSDEARRRYDVEEIIEGLANLYSEVTLEDAKRQLMMIRGSFRSEAGRLIDNVMDTSMVLDFMLRKVDDTKTGLYAIADDNIAFGSRCAWDEPEQLRQAIASHRPAIAERHPFTEEEIRAAGSGETPVIPNAQQHKFWNFLTDELKLYDQNARQICFNLWYIVNHAEEPGYDYMTADEYFEQEALFMDDLDDSTSQKAWQMLHNYIDHMPRWMLKGHAPAGT